MKEFTMQVSMGDITKIEKIIENANVSINGKVKEKIVGQIFAKRLLSFISTYREKFFYGDNNGNILVDFKVNIEVTGYVNKKAKRKGTSCVNKAFREVNKKDEVTIYPIEIKKFVVKGDLLRFVFNFNGVNEENIIEKAKSKNFKGINEFKDIKCVIPYVDENLFNEASLEKLIESARETMKKDADERKLIIWTFDVLKCNGLSKISGCDAAGLRDIYRKAKIHYPLFKKMSYEEQMKLLRRAVDKTCEYDNSISRGEHLYAKFLLEEFWHNGIHIIFRTKSKKYSFVKEYRTVKYMDNFMDKIKFANYKDSKLGCIACFTPEELYRRMVSTNG